MTDLRVAALRWMESNRFFDATGLGIGRSNVYFEGTRDEKVRRIRELGCDVFVDDLAEVLSPRRDAGGVPQDSVRQRAAKRI